jgi:NADPH-dependent 2,4-dienoyl-CoA reductase/sulfur reductase-like enzyme
LACVRIRRWRRRPASIGERGGIRVDEQMRTSNPDIFAVGDAIEVRDFVTGEWSLIALAGPANRQGRIAADVIAGRESRFRGTQGTSIIGLFGAAAAWVGASEKTLKRLGDSDYEKIYLYPNSHAGYYPGARPIAMKVLFRKVRRTFPGCAGARRGWRRQAHQRARHGAPDGRDDP